MPDPADRHKPPESTASTVTGGERTSSTPTAGMAVNSSRCAQSGRASGQSGPDGDVPSSPGSTVAGHREPPRDGGDIAAGTQEQLMASRKPPANQPPILKVIESPPDEPRPVSMRTADGRALDRLAAFKRDLLTDPDLSPGLRGALSQSAGFDALRAQLRSPWQLRSRAPAPHQTA